MSDDASPPSDPSRDGDKRSVTSDIPTEEPLAPSDIAQFVRHDGCPRFLKQRVEPGSEPDARDWNEAYRLMNPGLLGYGEEFEADQVEALAVNATKVIAPEPDDDSKAGVPAIDIDETWASSSQECSDQLQAAVEEAATLPTDTEEPQYILCFQAPLSGQVGDRAVSGKLDCLVLTPAAATERGEKPAITDPATPIAEMVDDTADSSATGPDPAVGSVDVAARLLEIKSAKKRKRAHHIQVAIYSALFEQTLSSEGLTCRIETSILTKQTAVEPGEPLDPFAVPTFSRYAWEFQLNRLLAADGTLDEILDSDLAELSFSIDRVCNNCAYQEACATRAVEDPTALASLSLLGLDPSVQERLQDAGVSNIRDLSELLPRQSKTQPTDDAPTLALPGEQQRQLESILPGSIHETVYRSQALRGEIDPAYTAFRFPPVLPEKGWISLPDDRGEGWSNIEGSEPGELIHVGLFVRPDMAIDRVAALGACVYADAYDEYITIGEVIDAVPDDTEIADEVEGDLFEEFLNQLFDAIETVASAIGDPEESVVHCYTYSDHEAEFLGEALDRHNDTLPTARAMRDLWSLDHRGHTDVDQSMVSPIQPIITDHFALAYPSEGLLAVADQFVPGWDLNTFDPLDGHPDDQLLRGMFREQFLNEQVPYLDDEPGIRLHLADGALSQSAAAEVASSDGSSEDGRYPIRKRSGGQFPLEYIWAVTPKHPNDTTPRLTPETVEEWDDGGDTDELQEVISRFYYRSTDREEPLQRLDVEYLIERLSYTLVRVVESIPYKNAYHPKEQIDATSLTGFDLPVTDLPAAARDYLRIEHDNTQEQTLSHYRQSLRDRARSGRSMPIRCTDIEEQPDGSLIISGELAYDALFADAETAHQMARQTRLRSSDGPSSGSWRLLTGMQPTTSASQGDSAQTNTGDDTTGTDTADAASSPDGTKTSVNTDTEPSVELTVDDSEDIKHSPPTLVDEFDPEAGTISLRTFPQRFKKNYSEFRVDHCGWDSPAGSNLDDPGLPPADREGHIAERRPVFVEPGELYMLDPMVDNFSAGKADYALRANTIEDNVLWQHLRRIGQGESPQYNDEAVVDPAAIEAFLDTLDSASECLGPNADQKAFIEAVRGALVTLQGPPGTGKTSGATAPALLGRAYARAQNDDSFVGIVVAPSHEAVDAVLEGTAAFLDDWRATEGGLEQLELVRILPSSPPAPADRADVSTGAVDVTYANYHSSDGAKTLHEVVTEMFDPASASQQLLFATPATLYRMFETVAARGEIDGESAPAAMRYPPGLADVVCVDEASMLNMPQWLLAGSTLKPSGQALVVGDHRQLSVVNATEWDETLRKPLAETNAYLSALEYVLWLNETAGGDVVTIDATESTSTDGGSRQQSTHQPPVEEDPTEQSRLPGFVDVDSMRENGGDKE